MRLVKRIAVWALFALAIAYIFAGPDVLKNAYQTAASGDAAGALKDVYGNTVVGISSAWNNVLKAIPLVPGAPAAFTADRAIVYAGTVKAKRLIRKAVRLAVLAVLVYLAIRFIPWAVVLGLLAGML